MKTTLRSVNSHVENMSEFAKAIYDQLIKSEKKLTNTFLAATLLELIEKAMKSCPELKADYLIRNDKDRQQAILNSAIENFEIQEILDFVEVQSRKSKNKLENKVGFLLNLKLKAIAAMYDLDAAMLIELSKTSLEEFNELFDVIFLAGMHNELDISKGLFE